LRFPELPVEFVGSFPDPRHRLEPILPEIGFLGRSNVGKSSLINAVVGRRIARTSATPGKTQYLNVFRFPTFYLLDLPGYGYAKLSLAERRRLRALVEDVVRLRTDLVAVAWLLDIRHPVSKEDLAIRDLLADARRETIVVLTKSDKLAQSARVRACRERALELEVDQKDVVVTSSAKGTGIDELGELVLEVMSGDVET
jgi:GTP-binding protein